MTDGDLNVTSIVADSTPTSILSLPSELIIIILALSGHSNTHYTERERIDHLCTVARVHSHFLRPAQDLLYSSLFIRNSGRAHGLAATLHSHPSLSALTRSISYLSDADQGHPSPLISILKLTEPTSLDLGARLFSHGESSVELRELLRGRKGLRAYGYGTSRWAITKSIDSGSLALVSELLPAWPELKELSLRNSATQYEGSPPSPLYFPAMPTYSLTRLTLLNVDIWFEEFDFLLGQSYSLLHLSMKKVIFCVNPTLSIEDQEQTTLHMMTTLQTRLTKLRTFHFLDFYTGDINLFLISCPELVHLEIAASALYLVHNLKFPIFLPPKLQSLQVTGLDLFEHLKLFEKSDPPVNLKEITLVGVGRESVQAGLFLNLLSEKSWEIKVSFRSIYS